MKRIAIVEDNPDNMLLVQTLLEDKYLIDPYENGVEAIRRIPETAPDVVLLDISLPEMDGVEVLRALRGDERVKSVPVIALTAHAMVGDRERYLNLGFNDYVSKPIVDEMILHGAIERCLTL